MNNCDEHSGHPLHVEGICLPGTWEFSEDSIVYVFTLTPPASRRFDFDFIRGNLAFSLSVDPPPIFHELPNGSVKVIGIGSIHSGTCGDRVSAAIRGLFGGSGVVIKELTYNPRDLC